MPPMATFPSSRLKSLPASVPALTARYGRRLPDAACLVLVVVIAKLAASLLWALIPVPEDSIWQPPPAAAPQNTVKRSGVDLSSISNAHLFGQYTAPVAPALADLAAAPDTQLNLTLLGILSNGRNDKDSRSRALIAAQGGEEKPYAVGDDVSRGVQLTAIFPDRVILNRNGRLETLRLDKESTSGLGDSPISQMPPSQDQEIDAGAAESLSQIRTQLLEDPSKVADYIRVQPVNSGSGLTGYRIYPGRDRSVFAAAGLRPGDIVTAVNGTSLNDPARSLQLLNDLSQSSQINLTVDRGGQPQSFSINLE